MLARILLLVCICVINTSYSHPQKHVSTKKVTAPNSSRVPSFSVIDITGNMDVNLHTGYAKSSMALTGNAQDLQNVKVRVSRRGILFIKLDDNIRRHGPISVDIRTRYIYGFAYVGKGTITGDHLRTSIDRLVINNQGTTRLGGTIRLGYLEAQGSGFMQLTGVTSPYLHVKLMNNARVKMTGTVGLSRLDADDNTWFSLSWVKTPTLTIRTRGKAYVQLAGIVNKLDAESCDFSQLNLRYLRARRSFVKTHDNSVAKISTTHHQHLLATDASDIRQYNLPEMNTGLMAFDGAILDMRPLNTAFVEEPTPHNR